MGVYILLIYIKFLLGSEDCKSTPDCEKSKVCCYFGYEGIGHCTFEDDCTHYEGHTHNDAPTTHQEPHHRHRIPQPDHPLILHHHHGKCNLVL